MAATHRHVNEMVQKAKQTLQTTKDPLEKLRATCMARGVNGIHGVSRMFRIFDDDGNRQISIAEFRNGITDYGCIMSRDEIQTIFNKFDSDASGFIDFDELLYNIRPPMNEKRRRLVSMAFQKLDKNKDSVITVDDLRGVYDVRQHPKYQSGELSEDDVLQTFLDTFESDGDRGTITGEEFENYYSGVSASIDHDGYFDLMMRKSWKL